MSTRSMAAGSQGAAVAAMEGVCGAGYTVQDNLTGGKLGQLRGTAAQWLDGLRSVYEESGGGLRGATVAAVESVKDAFAAGYTVLDNLTGGKLREIRDTFSEKLSPVASTVRGMLDAARSAASEGLESMHAAYEEHGGGIQGAAAAAVDGVKDVFDDIV